MAGGEAVSAAALSLAVTGLMALPEEARGEAARAIAARLSLAFGPEAANVVLKCQDAFMERGEEDAAAAMMRVLEALWADEDAAGRDAAA